MLTEKEIKNIAATVAATSFTFLVFAGKAVGPLRPPTPETTKVAAPSKIKPLMIEPCIYPRCRAN